MTTKIELILTSKGCNIISTKEINNNFLVHYKCSCGNITQTDSSNIYKTGWSGCKKCAGKRKTNYTNFKQAQTIFQEQGELLPEQEYVNSRTKLNYKCSVCKKEAFISLSDFKRGRKGCNTCKTGKEFLTLEEIENYPENVNETGEIWKRIEGGWISSFGIAKNLKGKLLTICPTKYRYRINGKHQYVSRLMAKAFKIEGYEKLKSQKYVVSFNDDNNTNFNLKNLYVNEKSNVTSKNGSKSRKSEKFKNTLKETLEDYKDIESVIVNLLPHHTIFKNGKIWNENRFLTFSKSGKYEQMCLVKKAYKVHRLVCFAFNFLPDKSKYEDYKDLQVNHIDGNTLNNDASNLEWVTQSENILHAYQTGLNKKLRKVLQYNIDTLEFISEHPSIAEASRLTGVPEHRIRYVCQNCDIMSKSKYWWEFDNPEETEEYSKK